MNLLPAEGIEKTEMTSPLASTPERGCTSPEEDHLFYTGYISPKICSRVLHLAFELLLQCFAVLVVVF
jgi:hypothetical protein